MASQGLDVAFRSVRRCGEGRHHALGPGESDPTHCAEPLSRARAPRDSRVSCEAGAGSPPLHRRGALARRGRAGERPPPPAVRAPPASDAVRGDAGAGLRPPGGHRGSRPPSPRAGTTPGRPRRVELRPRVPSAWFELFSLTTKGYFKGKETALKSVFSLVSNRVPRAVFLLC